MKTFFKIVLWLCVVGVIFHLLKYLAVLALLAGVLWMMRRKKTREDAVPVSDKEFYYDTETGEVFDIPKTARHRSTVHFE
jgi:hypothetical protein